MANLTQRNLIPRIACAFAQRRILFVARKSGRWRGGNREAADWSDLGLNASSDCVGHLLVVDELGGKAGRHEKGAYPARRVITPLNLIVSPLP